MTVNIEAVINVLLAVNSSKPWSTSTEVTVNSVFTGGAIDTRGASTVIVVGLTVLSRKTILTETFIAVYVILTYPRILAWPEFFTLVYLFFTASTTVSWHTNTSPVRHIIQTCAFVEARI